MRFAVRVNAAGSGGTIDGVAVSAGLCEVCEGVVGTNVADCPSAPAADGSASDEAAHAATEHVVIEATVNATNTRRTPATPFLLVNFLSR